MCQTFMKLVKAASSEQETPIQSLQINTFAFVGLQLRVATSRFSRVNIDQKVLRNSKTPVKCILMLAPFYLAVFHRLCGQ